ncbi:MAG: hypothetical protein IKE64_10355 [Thermoguttaceae bacterium]|nr:hypothetical protein [Thermoguttaceae bacterium]
MGSSTQIPLRFEGHGTRLYFPGETLAGSYSLADFADEAIEAVEVSVLWHTEGKGNEDFGVHAFWRRSLKAGDWIDPRTPGRFSVTLPNSPLSYEGELVKIYWVVRIRLFFADGRQEVVEHPFRLGNISSIRMLRALHSTEETDDRRGTGPMTEVLQ